jgi:hypothetical protein
VGGGGVFLFGGGVGPPPPPPPPVPRELLGRPGDELSNSTGNEAERRTHQAHLQA